MRTNYLYFALASAAMLSSCSSELDAPMSGEGQSLVTFTAQLPTGLGRAESTYSYGNGANATRLRYAVYEENSDTPLYVHGNETDAYGTATFQNLTAKIQLHLAQGKKYQLVFWADAPQSPYTFDVDTKTVTVDYADVKVNDDTLDAFYGTSILEVNSSTTGGSITLQRPFAQLNIATTDYAAAAAAGFEVTDAQVTVTDIANVLDLTNGACSATEGFDGTVAFAANGLASGSYTVAVEGKTMTYLSMNYVLVGNDNATTDVTLTVSDANHSETSEYTAVPVKANYRTNLYGSLLTNAVDYTVTLNPAFATPDNSVEIWDGVSTSAPEYSEDLQAYVINTPNEFAYFLANAGSVSTSRSSGKAFVLQGNIDMGGNTLPVWSTANNYMWGPTVIDGKGYTVSNFKCAVVGNCSAVIPHVSDITISNITFDNGVVGTDNPTDDVFAGVVVGKGYVVRMDNVHVTNCSVSGVNKVGGLIGLQDENDAIVNNCSVKNTTLNGYGEDAGCVGGLFGYISGYKDPITAKFTNCSVSDIKINVPDGEAKDSRGSAYLIGVVGNTAGGQVILENNKIEGENSIVCNFNIHPMIGSVRFNGVQITIDNEDINLNADLYISDADGLRNFRDDVNDDNSYEGKVVALAADIDLGGEEWKPIGILVKPTNRYFKGIFNGNNHVISNFKNETEVANEKDSTGTSIYGRGLFGAIENATIMNLTVNNATVGSDFKGNMIGAVCAYAYGSSAFKNVHVGNSIVRGFGKVAGMLGAAGNGVKSIEVTDCSVENTTVYGVYNTAGLVGLVNKGATAIFSNNTVGENFKFMYRDGDVYGNMTFDGITSEYWFYNDTARYANAAKYYNDGEGSKCELDGVTYDYDGHSHS